MIKMMQYKDTAFTQHSFTWTQSQDLRFHKEKYIFKIARFLFLLYVWNKFSVPKCLPWLSVCIYVNAAGGQVMREKLGDMYRWICESWRSHDIMNE